jgi:hypothetical protein
MIKLDKFGGALLIRLYQKSYTNRIAILHYKNRIFVVCA